MSAARALRRRSASPANWVKPLLDLFSQSLAHVSYSRVALRFTAWTTPPAAAVAAGRKPLRRRVHHGHVHPRYPVLHALWARASFPPARPRHRRPPPATGLSRWGTAAASHENAQHAFDRGAPVLVYPGGDWETFRPSWHSDRIEFGGRQGFIRLALERGAPIERAAKATGWATLTRIKVLSVAFGPPFGATVLDLPGRLPLPAKITVEVRPPIGPCRALRTPARARTGLRGDQGGNAGQAVRAPHCRSSERQAAAGEVRRASGWLTRMSATDC